MNEQRVSDWTLGDAIERLEASGPDSTFLVGPMDKPLVLAAFRELRERRSQRCETCGNGYESITGDIACPFIVDEMPRSGYCNFHYHKETDDADH